MMPARAISPAKSFEISFPLKRIEHLADGELVAVLGVGAVQRIFAGQKHGGAKNDHILGARSRDAPQAAQKGGR
ncbi:MAG: hypothetical protein H7X74_07975 [Methyloceanibacter sp.]|nr:hypothetical protein [Methyloceanibacter sp.]